MIKSKWIWYYGDFEFYHLKIVNSRRYERDLPFPTFWKQSEIYSNVRFKKQILINKTITFNVQAHGIGFVIIGANKFAFNSPITLDPGEYTVYVRLNNFSGLPCIYVDGDLISDDSWQVDCFDNKWVNAGYNNMYIDPNDNPEIFKFDYDLITPKLTKTESGTLYDFDKETFIKIKLLNISAPFTMYFGETDIEALDTENSYLLYNFTENDVNTLTRGFGCRYAFIPNGVTVEFNAYYEHLPYNRAFAPTFNCSDQLINQIYNIAKYTFELNSREFYFDGIKRDRWVWSGDSYQSYFTERYLNFDLDTIKRTILALSGKEKITQHINTINDYTFYWLISIYDYYITSGDIEFVKNIYPRMKEYLDFIISRLDENNLVSPIEEDWIFIDWADIDKDGPNSAEQMLLLRSIECFSKCAEILGKDANYYTDLALKIKKMVNQKFWDNDKGAFIDGFISGKRQVTRHANIFAVIFDIASEEQKTSIIKNVFNNDKIPAITTPYFKFYELESMCLSNNVNKAVESIKEYWGQMIEAGATSFWEEFESGKCWKNQLSMYGLKYGKSLCHSWGASPIYIIGKYILGVYPTSAGYKTFEVKPNLDALSTINATLPINGGYVKIIKQNSILQVTSSKDGGTLIINKQNINLAKDKTIEIKL